MLKNYEEEKSLHENVVDAVVRYYEFKHKNRSEYKPGDRISYAGRIFDEEDILNLVDAALEFWLTSGKYSEIFEREFSKFLGVKYSSIVNSGSSANLLAFMALTSPKLGTQRIKPGEEVITVAAAFPTTVAPIIQYGAIPVFLDIALPNYNIDVSQLDAALTQKTRAVMLAHTMGNPFNITAVKDFCLKNGLWLIEDNCDALGSEYLIDGVWRYTGTIGHIATSSFYPPHHMTMGEGGAVYTDNWQLKSIVESLRDWGRDCWCKSGHDDTCKRRFEQQFGQLPLGYDHKYVYSHFGYNLKATDLQAAIGCAQLKKLPSFIDKRRSNWQQLYEGLSDLTHVLILPQKVAAANPSWFGFLITIRQEAGFSRDDIVQYLEAKGIQTRMLFAGNLLKHPCFDEMRAAQTGYRTIGELPNTNYIMNNTFWLGVYPGLSAGAIEYIIECIHAFTNNY